jgi:signal transduction histidine kinase
MRLSQFIRTRTEKIIVEFEAFARSVAPPGTMDVVALRDHAQQMLTVIARDLETPQTEQEGAKKAQGRSDADEDISDTPAHEHGAGRAESGFTIEEMVSEYRALRASVTRLWIEEKGELTASDGNDLIRFNEAIDQSLAESTARFTENLEHTRETFLGILGHDLRTPLGAIITSAKFMLEAQELPPTAYTLTGRIVSSALRMNHMVADLLDFTRGRLGAAIPIAREDMDLAQLLNDAVEESRAAHPGAMVRLETSGALRGEWDSARLSQVVSNLISNAINHGSKDTPVTVKAEGERESITFSVHNDGRPIAENQLHQIFNPLSRTATESRDPGHLGLGLYIAKQIVSALSGTIQVESNEVDGTTFTVRLPRRVR